LLVAGAGKSIRRHVDLSVFRSLKFMMWISSAIIQEICATQKSGLGFLAFFYCDFNDDQKRDRCGLLLSVLTQICHQSDAYSKILFNFYLEHSHGSQYPGDDALVRCSMEILKLAGQPPVYLIVDGLDECSNAIDLPSPREKNLMLVKDLIDSQIPNLPICVTSRPEADIMAVLDTPTLRSVSLHDERGQIEDINNYIKSMVTTDSTMRKRGAEDKQLVIDFLVRNADGCMTSMSKFFTVFAYNQRYRFRWIDCQLGYLRRCLPARIRHVLAELPVTLEKPYERKFRDIDGVNWSLA
jgi:hypothetical protein